ncbi:MAG: nucleotidyltransferase family protein [Nanobdellota archaeon]
MLLDICFGNKSVWRVLMLYAETPGAGFTRKEIKEYTMLGNKSVTLALRRLLSFGIINEQAIGTKKSVYKLNHGNSYMKEILNVLKKERKDMNFLPYSFSVVLREYVREVIDRIDPKNIYLFGSVSKGTYREDSDMDIAVIVENKSAEDDLLLNEISDKFSDRHKIQSFLITVSRFEKKDSFTEDIIKHGIRLV